MTRVDAADLVATGERAHRLHVDRPCPKVGGFLPDAAAWPDDPSGRLDGIGQRRKGSGDFAHAHGVEHHVGGLQSLFADSNEEGVVLKADHILRSSIPPRDASGKITDRMVMAIPESLRRLAGDVDRETLRFYRAPGRVNLIGEHTDYNHGWVMPAAIQMCTWVASAPRRDRRLVMTSRLLGETVEVDLSRRLEPRRAWSDYVVGVAWALERAGVSVSGTTLLIDSEVPSGSGLSSSAALTVAVAVALADRANAVIPPLALAQLCQSVENAFVGAQSGIMDQFVVVHGQAHHALLLDCRSLHFSALTVPARVRFVIANTMVKHSHAAGGYNTRRQECEQALARLRAVDPLIATLRDVTPTAIDRWHHVLTPVDVKRVRHVVTENARVLEMAEALRRDDLDVCRACMSASHRSLRDDFEVSTPELDVMVAIADGVRGVLGARMTGGGFGGCVLCLADAGEADAVARTIKARYRAETGIDPETWVTGAADGARRIDPE